MSKARAKFVEWFAQAASAVRELRVFALALAAWIAWEMVGWVTSVEPTDLGGMAVAAIFGEVAILVAAVAALSRRHEQGSMHDFKHPRPPDRGSSESRASRLPSRRIGEDVPRDSR